VEFERFVDDALSFVQKYKGRGRPPKEFEDYIQKRVLDHMRGLRYVVRLEGVIANKTYMYTGSADGPDGNVSRLLKDSEGRPVVTGDAFRGATRKFLQAMSINAGIAEAEKCKTLASTGRKGVKDYTQCGVCLACGILGFMNLKGASFASRVKVDCGRVMDNYQIVVKPGINRDGKSGTVNWQEAVCEGGDPEGGAEGNAGAEGRRRGKTTLFYMTELAVPETIQVPFYVVMANMAVGEMGAFLYALDVAMDTKVCRAQWTNWTDDPSRWKLVYVPVLPGGEEVYAGPKAVALIKKMVMVAGEAASKGLFKPYVLRSD